MGKKSLKIVIGVLGIVIVVLVGMILVKGKNLNPFEKEQENSIKTIGEGGQYQESISLPIPEDSSSSRFEDGKGTMTEGMIYQGQMGE